MPWVLPVPGGHILTIMRPNSRTSNSLRCVVGSEWSGRLTFLTHRETGLLLLPGTPVVPVRPSIPDCAGAEFLYTYVRLLSDSTLQVDSPSRNGGIDTQPRCGPHFQVCGPFGLQ